MSIPPDAGNTGGSTPPPPVSPSSNISARFKAAWNDPSKRPMLIFGFGAVGLAVIMLFVAALQIITPPPPSGPTPPPTIVCDNKTGCPVTAIVPKELHVRDRTIDIVPVAVPKNGEWHVTAQENQAEWILGSLINYLIGLPATTENSDMLQALQEGDSISLELSNGQTLDFTFSERRTVSSTTSDFFSQQRPGLTLVQLGDNGSDRTIVRANYDAGPEGSKTVPTSLVAINTPIDIDVARVKVLSGRLVENAPGIPVGSAFYLVDFTVENLGSEPIDAANFVIDLSDYARVKYPLSATASELGPYPAPTGQLQAGLSGTYTSGFEVPSNVTGPVLTWSFKPMTSTTATANVAVPLVGPTPTPDPRTQVVIQITQAYFTPDSSELIIVGGIGNPTNSLVPVGPPDISLSTQEGILATLISADPALPWRIAPNSNINFTLHFSRLPSSQAVLRILQTSFALTFQ